MFTEAFCTVSGKVQRVGFRDFVSSLAEQYRMTGWVRNKEDGTVEVLAQGIPDDLKLFIQELNVGSALARVDSVAVDFRTVTLQHDDFKILS